MRNIKNDNVVIRINGVDYRLSDSDKLVIARASRTFAFWAAGGVVGGLLTGAYISTVRRWSIPGRIFLGVFLGAVGFYPAAYYGAYSARKIVMRDLEPSPFNNLVHNLDHRIADAVRRARSGEKDVFKTVNNPWDARNRTNWEVKDFDIRIKATPGEFGSQSGKFPFGFDSDKKDNQVVDGAADDAKTPEIRIRIASDQSGVVHIDSPELETILERPSNDSENASVADDAVVGRAASVKNTQRTNKYGDPILDDDLNAIKSDSSKN